MKTFLFRSMIGIFFGAFISIVVTSLAIYFGGYETLDSGIFIKNSAGAIFCGWLFTVSPLYFENNNLTLLQQTVFHFFTTIIPYFILATSIGWIPLNVKSVLLGIGLFIIIYTIIWTCFYLYFKNLFKKMNDELKHI